jgi:CRISPR associated protein Cas1
MAAAKNVPQLTQSHNSLVPRHGVVTLFGYGIRVRVDGGHLVLQDGIAADRREARLARIGHGLKRLVIIGSDGLVSLAALRWLADQNAAFVMLERDGTVLVTTGPVRPSDARLRRLQALSGESGIALYIARELIDKKLAGQERVARYKLLATQTADTISRYRKDLVNADSPKSIRQVESLAARASVLHHVASCSIVLTVFLLCGLGVPSIKSRPQVARQAAVLLAFNETLKLAYQGQESSSAKVVVEHYRWHELTPLERNFFDFGFS